MLNERVQCEVATRFWAGWGPIFNIEGERGRGKVSGGFLLSMRRRLHSGDILRGDFVGSNSFRVVYLYCLFFRCTLHESKASRSHGMLRSKLSTR